MGDTATAAAESSADEEGALHPEVIERRDPEPEPKSALEAASEAALAMPGVPGRDEFLSLAMQARVLSLSGAAPKAVRNNPHIAFHIAMVGRDLGISPSAALELIDVIVTKDGAQLSLSPQLLNGQIRRLGLGSIRPAVQERDRCVARAIGPDGEVLGETEFTWADARDAGLVMPDCEPGAHSPKCRNYNSKAYERCNQGYRTYPRRMMWWRAAGFCADDYFPEAGLGLYSPEELGAVVDEEGRPIDPASVELPPGFTDPQEERRQRQLNAGPKAADAGELNELVGRIKALPASALGALKERWAQPRSAESGGGPMLPVDSEGKPAARLLTASSIKAARALVTSFEKDVAAGRYADGEPEPQETTEPEPQEEPEPAADTQPASAPRQGVNPSQRQMARLHALLKDKRNITDGDRHKVISELIGREITSASELNAGEAVQAINQLQDEPDWGDSA